MWLARVTGTLPRVREMDLLDGRYRLRELLHADGARQWWYADDEALDHDVEVTVSDETFLDPTFAHPHLVRVYAVGECDSQRYVVSEPVTGVSLRARMAKGPLPWPAAVRTAAEIAGVLAAVHGRGLVYGDLRPADVVLTPAGAKVTRLSVRTASDGCGPATDVYALGRLLHLMIAGGTQDGMPLSVVDLCAQCLSPDSAERPTSHKVARVLATAGIAPGEDPVAEEVPRTTALVPVPPPRSTSPVGPASEGRPAHRPDAGDACDTGDATEGTAARRRRRPMVVVPAAVAAGVAAAVVTSLLLLDNGTGAGPSNPAVPAAGVRAQTGDGCQVRYQIRSDVQGRFSVDITLTNLGGSAVPAWTLVFDLPGDQKLVRGRAARWQQVGDEVSMRTPDPATPLPPSGSTTVGFDGTYRAANPWPTAFTINGTDCAYAVVDSSGKVRSTGTPSRQAPVAGTHPASPGASPPDGSVPSPGTSAAPTLSPTATASASPGDGGGGHHKPSDKPSHR